MTRQELDLYQQRYAAAAHAMQSGVKCGMNLPGRSHATDPKDLRVGINSAMVEHGALAGGLLINKGIITPEEYYKALAEGMEAERDKYEHDLSERLGKPIKLA